MQWNRFIFYGIAAVVWGLWFSGCSLVTPTVYVVARDPTWFPLSLVGRERNVSAFSDDLLWEISKRKGFKITTIRTGPGGIESGLLKGDFDAAMTTLEPNAYRRDQYSFSESYFFSGPILIVPSDSSAKSLFDMADQRVGIRSGALSYYEIDVGSEIIYRFYDNVITGIEEMLRGDIEGVVMDLVPAYGFSKGIYAGKIKVVGKPLTKAGVRLVTAKGENEELIADFNRGLIELQEDGTYLKLLDKWGLTVAP